MRRTFLRLFSTGLGWIAAAASVAAQAEPLTLDEVLRATEDVNLSVLSNREFIGQAEQSARLARSGLLPRVDLRASQGRSDAGGILGRSDNFSAGVSGSIALIDFQQFGNLRAARQAIVVSRHDYASAVQTVMASMAAVFFEHQRDLAFDTVINSNIERANVLLDLARNQLAAGVATQIDVTRAEAELVSRQQEKLQQQTVILDSALRLKRLLNRSLGAPLVLEDFKVVRELDPTIVNLALDDVLARRADYQAAFASAEEGRLEIRAAGAERLPTIDLTGQVGVNSEVPFDDDQDESWSAGVQLSLPVFDGNRIRANVSLAESRLRQREFQLADLQNTIDSELRISLQDVQSQIAQIGVAEKNLSLASDELRLARVRYEQGVADNRELIDAENRYTASSFNLVSAIYNYHVARVELARVRGDVRLILAERAP